MQKSSSSSSSVPSVCLRKPPRPLKNALNFHIKIAGKMWIFIQVMLFDRLWSNEMRLDSQGGIQLFPIEKYQCWFVTLPSNLSDLSPAVVLVLAGPKVVQVDFECHRTTLVGFQTVFSGEWQFWSLVFWWRRCQEFQLNCLWFPCSASYGVVPQQILFNSKQNVCHPCYPTKNKKNNISFGKSGN